VHDGARPLLSADVLKKSIEASKKYNAAVAAVRVKDTIKIVEENNFIKETLPRNKLWAVQTPQIFNRKLLLKCYEMAVAEGVTATDDASLLEYYGYKVKIVEGDYFNIKITTSEDIILAERIIEERIE
jgi:2-C-methyl-D-erythritol 4-phosphate cytidylyltransferase